MDWTTNQHRIRIQDPHEAQNQPTLTVPQPPDHPTTQTLEPSRFEWRNPVSIPRRQWLYGQHYIRRFVSATFAPGGVGKSSLVLAEALAMVTGRDLLGHKPAGKLRIWCWNGEDPREEVERRIIATCIHYGIEPGKIADRLYLNSGRDVSINLATENTSGFRLETSTIDALSDALATRRIDVLVIDPFVSSHSIHEKRQRTRQRRSQGTRKDC
jgi:RecA-family ATPase